MRAGISGLPPFLHPFLLTLHLLSRKCAGWENLSNTLPCWQPAAQKSVSENQPEACRGIAQPASGAGDISRGAPRVRFTAT